MARELLRRRSDTKVLTNELLSRFPEFDDLFIGLDVLGAVDGLIYGPLGLAGRCGGFGGKALLVLWAGCPTV